MAKKSSKPKGKLVVKKYLTAGYNSSGMSQTLQKPAYTSQRSPYLTDAELGIEEDKLDYYNTRAAAAKTKALKEQQAIEAANKEEVNSTLSSSATTLAKAASKDLTAGTLGKFFVPKAADAGLAQQQAVANYSVPSTTAAASTGAESAIAQSANSVAVDTTAANAAATTANNVASAAPAQMSGLASAGIGAGLQVAGMASERLTDDKSEYTYSKRERTGNIAGEGLKAAGKGFGIGATIGSVVPGVGNVVGGVIGGTIGAGIGVIKGVKENKTSKKRADELQKEQDALAGAYQTAYVNSRLTGADTGFGYNSSTNMNNNYTAGYFQAKTGGVRKLDGGYEVPIGPNGEVKYVGNSHKQGGIMESPNTEVEGGETKDNVTMNNGKSKEYFFSRFLKYKGEPIASTHEELVKSGASQAEIQRLAKIQEKIAGRSPQQVAKYGGPRMYQTAGPKEEEETKKGKNTLSQDNATGEYVVRDANGNELSRSINRREAKRKAEAGVSNVTPAVTPAAPIPWDGKVDTPQITYDLQKPLLGKESMTKEEYDAAVAKYGLGLVDPQAATYDAYNDSKDGKNIRKNIEEDYILENQDNLFSRENALGSRYVNPVFDKDYNVLKYETDKGATERQAAEKAVGNVTAASYGQPATTVAPTATVTPTPVVDATTTTTAANTTNQTPPQTPPANNAGTTVIKEGATENDSKLVGARDPNLLPQFENAKTNPIWSKDNYGSWKTRVNTALDNEATATEVANYISTYSGPYAEQVKKRAAGKTGAELVKIIREEATDNQPGIFHEAVRLALENTKPKDEPKKEDVKVEDVKDETPQPPLEPRVTPCGPGMYRDSQGNCKPIMEVPKDRMSPTLIAGVSQLIPPIYGMMNKYQAAKGIPGVAGAAGVKGAILPRVNLNRERDQSAKSNVAVRNFIQSTNTGPGGIVAAMTANKDMNEQMLNIANSETRANRELVAEEAKLGQQASQFNVGQEMDRQRTNAEINKFNKQLEVNEKQYRREEILGSIDTAVSRIAGVVKDERMYKATERLAKALDQTNSYDRFEVYEKFLKEKKRKDSPFANMSDFDLRRMAAAVVGFEDGIVPPPAPPKDGTDVKKLGGTKKYISRLGDLKYNKVKV
jgi:hypothetical protein